MTYICALLTAAPPRSDFAGHGPYRRNHRSHGRRRASSLPRRRSADPANGAGRPAPPGRRRRSHARLTAAPGQATIGVHLYAFG